jgi:tripartite-type tricarboxylate transporter receptor subunit TctC
VWRQRRIDRTIKKPMHTRIDPQLGVEKAHYMNTGLTRRGALAGISSLVLAPAFGQSGRAITLMHGFPAGTNVDIVARLVAEQLGARLGQTIVVEPRPGAGGTTGAAAVTRSPADGSVFAVVAGGHAISAALYNKLPYDPVEDFSFISMVQEFPFIIVTYPDRPGKIVADIIREAQSNPGKLTCGTGGNGTGMHLAFELFIAMSDIKIQHVPYRGSPQAVTDLLAKRLDLVVAPPSAVISQIRNGDLRALAITGRDRFFMLPDVPSLSDSVKDYVVTSWIGVAGPRGLPDSIVTRVNAELQKILTDPALAQRLRELEGDARPTTPSEFKARVVEDVTKWMKVVRDANIPRI